MIRKSLETCSWNRQLLHFLNISNCWFRGESLDGMVYAMADTKSGPISPKTPVKEKIVGIYDDFFKVSNYDMMELDKLRSLKLKMKKLDLTYHLEMFWPFHNPG